MEEEETRIGVWVIARMGHLRGSSLAFPGCVRSPTDRHGLLALSFSLRTLECRGIKQHPTVAQELICFQRQLLGLPVCQGTANTHT